MGQGRDGDRFVPVSKLTAEAFERGTRVTYFGQVHGTMSVLKRMRERTWGTIVNVNSALGYRFVPLPYLNQKAEIVMSPQLRIGHHQ